MYGIKDALKAIGKDTIQELFDFIAIAYEARDKDIDPDEYEKVKDMCQKVGFAIYMYAVSKERINATNQSTEN